MQQSALILSNIIIVVDNQHRRFVSIFAHHLLHSALMLVAIVDILQCRLIGKRLVVFCIIIYDNSTICLHTRNNNYEVGTFIKFALHLDFTIMQFHERLHQCQADACSAGSTFSLEETFEHLVGFIFINTLTCIANIYTELVAYSSNINKDITACRCIFQCVAKKIKHHACNLFLVGNNHIVASEFVINEMQLYLLALSSELKIAYPNFQSLNDIKADKLEFHLTILDFAEIENVAHQLLQGNGITLHRLQQFTTLALDATIF